jgi:FG-GAP-like repeat/Domain of unknown function (DUF4214)
MHRATTEIMRAGVLPRSGQFSIWRRVSLTSRLSLTLGQLLLLFFSMSVAERAAAQGLKFTSPVTYPAGAPYVITSGDFNNDGKVDLVAGDVNHNDLVMLLGNGDGSLKPPVTYHMAAAPYYLTANDFNRDGKLDLATVNPYAANISILFGKGDGSFEPAVDYNVGRFPGHIRAVDFNRDGWLDLAVLGGNKDVDVFLGNGNGTFQNPTSYVFPQPPGALGVGDFNGDGKVDLIVGISSTRTVSVMLGNGDGTFQTPISSSSSAVSNGTGPYAIVVGDFDRDGKLDAALSDEYLKILKGNGDGTFKPPSFNVLLRNTSPDLKSADFNGDGKLDLVSAGVFNAQALQIMLGNGDGTFQDAGDQVSGSNSISVVVTDLNGDTRSDIAANINNQLAVALVNVTPGNPDDTDYFVHQHYLDFLDREPDTSGFGFWSNQIASCGTDQQCVEIRRINVSAAFYLSIEFQRTAFLVERLYKTAYGDATGSSTDGGPLHDLAVPVVRRNELLLDTQQVGQGVVVNQSGWQTTLENNRQNFIGQFVQRSRFLSAYPTSMTPSEFVDRLNQNAGGVLSPSERATAIGLFGSATDTSNTAARAQALRQVAENQNLYNAEFNRAFVLMQYFGYLRRNPNEGQDTDYSGYEFWLNKLNAFNGNFINAEMVKAFILSSEYRNRFTP